MFCAVPCQSSLTATSVPQYLNSPYWPNVFPQAECTWNITASNQNNFVELRFLYFSLRNNNLQVFSFVLIFETI